MYVSVTRCGWRLTIHSKIYCKYVNCKLFVFGRWRNRNTTQVVCMFGANYKMNFKLYAAACRQYMRYFSECWVVRMALLFARISESYTFGVRALCHHHRRQLTNFLHLPSCSNIRSQEGSLTSVQLCLFAYRKCINCQHCFWCAACESTGCCIVSTCKFKFSANRQLVHAKRTHSGRRKRAAMGASRRTDIFCMRNLCTYDFSFWEIASVRLWMSVWFASTCSLHV